MAEPEPTVFLVDDDAQVCEALQSVLESVKIPVETFSSARAFLDAYEPHRPGCVVADVFMPGMSGLNLQNELLKRSIGLPVIITTGHADVPMAIHAMKAGAFDFLEKPFGNQTLLALHIVETILDHRARWPDHYIDASIISRIIKNKPVIGYGGKRVLLADLLPGRTQWLGHRIANLLCHVGTRLTDAGLAAARALWPFFPGPGADTPGSPRLSGDSLSHSPGGAPAGRQVLSGFHSLVVSSVDGGNPQSMICHRNE